MLGQQQLTEVNAHKSAKPTGHITACNSPFLPGDKGIHVNPVKH